MSTGDFMCGAKTDCSFAQSFFVRNAKETLDGTASLAPFRALRKRPGVIRGANVRDLDGRA